MNYFVRSFLVICLSLILIENYYCQKFYKINNNIYLTENSFIDREENKGGNFSSSLPLRIGIVMGATATAFLLDNSVRNNLTGNPTNNDSFLMRVGHSYGDFYYNLYFATGLHLTSYILKSKSLALTGKSLIESLILGGLASISIKFIFGRSRPYKEEGNFKFNFFETENKNNSLPSGHVITAFTTSTILSKSIDNFYISLVLYALSGLTFYQRLATDNHWFSDAFIGAALGYFIGEYTYNRNYENMSKGEGPSIIPFLYKDNFGVNFNYFF